MKDNFWKNWEKRRDELFIKAFCNKEDVMKKVRVLKEMPFAKVGEEFLVNQYGEVVLVSDGQEMMEFSRQGKDSLIDTGWLEWVEEEKSLAEKLKEAGYIMNVSIASLARTHYLAKFDEACEHWAFPDQEAPEEHKMYQRIRKSLEQA